MGWLGQFPGILVYQAWPSDNLFGGCQSSSGSSWDTLQITNWHYQCATVQLERSLHAVSAAATFTLCNVRILKYGAEHGAENTKMGTFYQGHRAKIS